MTSRTPKYNVRRALRRTGWDVVRFRGAFEDVQRRLLSQSDINCLLDVGANEGQYSQRIRQLGYSGRIVAFEPLRVAYERLRVNFADDKTFEAHQIAIADSPGSMPFNVSGNLVSSSLLGMSDIHREADPASAYHAVESVEVSTLDAIAPAGENLWLKIDVQGAEDRVLAGASATLDRVRVMQLELSLVGLYDGAPLIEEVIATLRGLGFEPVYLTPGFADPTSGAMLQTDGLFVRA